MARTPSTKTRRPRTQDEVASALRALWFAIPDGTPAATVVGELFGTMADGNAHSTPANLEPRMALAFETLRDALLPPDR